MVTRRIISVVILLVCLSACNVNPLQSPAPTVDATQLFQSALETATWGIPTRTPAPTATPTATSTPLPSATPTSNPTPLPVVISKDNIKDLNATLQIGASRVMDVVFSPDSSQLLVLTASQMMLFDASSGQQVWQTGLDMMFTKSNFTPDGKKIRTLTRGGGIQEWDAKTGQKGDKLSDIQPKIVLNALSSSTNRLMTSNYIGEATVYDTDGFKTVGSFPRSNLAYGLMELALTSKGDHVLMYGWHTDNQPLAMVFKSKDWSFESLAEITGREFDFTFSGNDQRIAALRNQTDAGDLSGSSTVSMWPVDDYKLYVRSTIQGTTRQMALSPDGSTIYLVLDNEPRIAVLDVEKARSQYFKDINANTHSDYVPQWLEGHKYPLNLLSSSPDGKMLASCDESGDIKIWDSGSKTVTKDIQLKTAIAPNYTASVGLIADRHLFARTTISQTHIEVVDGLSGDTIKTFGSDNDHFYSAISLSADGSLLAAAETQGSEASKSNPPQKLVIWNVASGRQVFNMPSGHNRRLEETRISPNNQYLASVSHGQLYTWDINSATVKNSLGGYSTCDFSADSRNILYDNADYGVYITEVSSGKLLNFQRAEYIRALSYAPDGLTAAVGAWNLVDINEDLVFYMDTQPPYQKKQQVINDLRSGIDFLAYSPDGKMLATLDAYGTLYINDTQTGAQLARLDNLTDPAGLTFSKDGSAILIASTDGSVLVLEAVHGQYHPGGLLG